MKLAMLSEDNSLSIYMSSDLLSTIELLTSSLAFNLLANSIKGMLSSLSKSSRSCLYLYNVC